MIHACGDGTDIIDNGSASIQAVTRPQATESRIVVAASCNGTIAESVDDVHIGRPGHGNVVGGSASGSRSSPVEDPSISRTTSSARRPMVQPQTVIATGIGLYDETTSGTVAHNMVGFRLGLRHRRRGHGLRQLQ